jgi:hypothetical protein
MRLAVIIGSAYEKNGTLPKMGSAEIDCELAARRLAEPDAAFVVHRFAADRDLPAKLERFLSVQKAKVEQLLIYFAGYAVLSPSRGPGFVLDGSKVAGLAASVLRGLVEKHAASSCIIVDAATVLESGQTVASVVSAMGTTLSQGGAGVSALVAARPSDAADSAEGSPFTNLWVTVLDWLASGREPIHAVDLGRLFEGLCADASMWRAIPAGQVFPRAASFVVLPPLDGNVARRPSDRPPSERPLAAPGEDSKGRQSVYLTYAHGTARWTVSLAPKKGDSAGALEQMLADRPEDLGLRDCLVEFYSHYGHPEKALEHCRFLARLAPARAETYRRARALFERIDVPDAAWNATRVLTCLGASGATESAASRAAKQGGLLAVRDTIFESDWREALTPSPDDDPALDRLLDAVGPAAVRVGVSFAKQKRRQIELRPEWLHDVDQSTTTLAKTLAWTSRVLGMSPPSLYVGPELGATLDVVPSDKPAVLAGRGLCTGLGLSQLAFLWGRHLGRLRPAARVFAFFNEPDELVAFIEAAAAVGGAAEAHAAIPDADGKRFHAALRAEVQGAELERLQAAARDFSLLGLAERARRAAARVELAGVRAGLLACGDVCIAAKLIERFPATGVTTTADQKGELFAFAISDGYGALRQRLGVASAA